MDKREFVEAFVLAQVGAIPHVIAGEELDTLVLHAALAWEEIETKLGVEGEK